MVRKRKSGGQALIEFALVIPIMLLLLVFLFDLGRIMYYYSAISNAAREGARHYIVDYDATSAEIETITKSYMIGVDVTAVSVSAYTNDAGNFAVVSVTYTFEPATPMVEIFTGGDITLTAQSTMQLER